MATGIIKLVTGYLPKLFSGTTKRKRAMPVLKKRSSLLGTTKRKRVLKNVAKHAGAAIGAGVTGAAIGAGAGFSHAQNIEGHPLQLKASKRHKGNPLKITTRGPSK
tara:strand:- start:1917 stop:2234 length:318 start_codon:yes stop_codon:yes gene_type:complete